MLASRLIGFCHCLCHLNFHHQNFYLRHRFLLQLFFFTWPCCPEENGLNVWLFCHWCSVVIVHDKTVNNHIHHYQQLLMSMPTILAAAPLGFLVSPSPDIILTSTFTKHQNHLHWQLHQNHQHQHSLNIFHQGLAVLLGSFLHQRLQELLSFLPSMWTTHGGKVNCKGWNLDLWRRKTKHCKQFDHLSLLH